MKVLKATFYRVLVKVDRTKKQEEVQRYKDMGLELPDSFKEDEYSASAQTTGIVVEIGPEAFDAKVCKGPQYKVGDRVIFQSHRGIRIKRIEDGKSSMYRLLNDDDIWAVVELEEADYEGLADECRTAGK